ncbi:hypothetical protein HCDG_06744 [Histoplasma capsulatum H143]|uniref:Uncharacterized protein n=1 Tax=Ajellomyces capsulatus (strain H143) TaxID=544712 RepID=C6HKL3_AJECH|nr:hypothetical protein HCDG_06744 [Histoplasma capsulatum H143]
MKLPLLCWRDCVAGLLVVGLGEVDLQAFRLSLNRWNRCLACIAALVGSAFQIGFMLSDDLAALDPSLKVLLSSLFTQLVQFWPVRRVIILEFYFSAYGFEQLRRWERAYGGPR